MLLALASRIAPSSQVKVSIGPVPSAPDRLRHEQDRLAPFLDRAEERDRRLERRWPSPARAASRCRASGTSALLRRRCAAACRRPAVLCSLWTWSASVAAIAREADRVGRRELVHQRDEVGRTEGELHEVRSAPRARGSPAPSGRCGTRPRRSRTRGCRRAPPRRRRAAASGSAATCRRPARRRSLRSA